MGRLNPVPCTTSVNYNSKTFAGGGTRGSSAAGWTQALPPGRDGIFKPSAGTGQEQEVGERTGL